MSSLKGQPCFHTDGGRRGGRRRGRRGGEEGREERRGGRGFKICNTHPWDEAHDCTRQIKAEPFFLHVNLSKSTTTAMSQIHFVIDQTGQQSFNLKTLWVQGIFQPVFWAKNNILQLFHKRNHTTVPMMFLLFLQTISQQNKPAALFRAENYY